MKTVRHTWSWEHTSLSRTSAYCVCCGIQRIQFKNDFDSLKVEYFYYGTPLKKAGSCKNNISNKNLALIVNILNRANLGRKQEPHIDCVENVHGKEIKLNKEVQNLVRSLLVTEKYKL